MASWTLVPCLVQLRTEFNQVAPARAKGADGSIGDQAHAGRTSDHNPDETGAVPIHDADKVNEVHALDITTDLRAGDLTLEKCVQFILARCRSGAETRLRYIIFNRRIWAADEAWVQQTYVGSGDPHTGHAHFSSSYVTAREADTSPWHLEELVMPTPEEFAEAVWNYPVINPYITTGNNKQPAQTPLRFAPSLTPHTETQKMIADLAAVVAEQGKQIAALAAKVDKISVGGVDVPALVKAVNDDAARRAAS